MTDAYLNRIAIAMPGLRYGRHFLERGLNFQCLAV
jgi:hypothetical protein